MRGWLPWIAAGLVGACYSPRPTADCQVICSAALGDDCPDGFTCGASGMCSASGTACPGDPGGPQICFGEEESIAKPCVPTVPPGEVMLTGTIETDADPRCVAVDQLAGGPKLCVIAGEQIVIGKPVHAVGSRPLVLAATDAITVTAMLDARSVRGEVLAGAGAIPCPAPIAGGETLVGAGGCGGSFNGSGGLGGAAEGVASTMPAEPIPFPAHVRGGCPGGAGAIGVSAGAGKPGAGGGALYLIAKREINVQAVITANGAGALLEPPEVGARFGGGGGGGGSGGLIVLEAPTITFGGEARLLALGGGGAGGAGGAANQPSLAGGDSNPVASPPFSSLTAPGGFGGPNGGRGGDGSAMTLLNGAAGMPGTMDGGGGGGGGGAGFIMLRCKMCSTSGAVIFPPPIL